MKRPINAVGGATQERNPLAGVGAVSNRGEAAAQQASDKASKELGF
jgi:hypothetical protein